MKPPICPVCHQNCDGKYIAFADYQSLPEGWCGHPNGYECFCKDHDHLARRLSHLSANQAIEIIKQTHRIPKNFVPPPMLAQDKKQPLQENFTPTTKPADSPQMIVFWQQQNRTTNSATLLLLFAIGMLVVPPVIGFSITSNEIRLRSSGRVTTTDVIGLLAFLLFGLASAALFGYLSCKSFKLARSKEPRLKLDSTGFSDLTLDSRHIFWRDIEKIKLIERRARYTTITFCFIRMTLNRDSDYKRRTPILKRFFRKIASSGYDLEIPISHLNAPQSAVFSYFESFYRKFGSLR